MRKVTATIEGMTPYSQSQMMRSKKPSAGGEAAREEKFWREKMHVNDKGNVVIPNIALKTCLFEYAKFKNEKVPGKGSERWTKHFEAGVLVPESVDLGVKAEDVKGEWLSCSPQGRRGGRGVMRKFPMIEVPWSGEVTFLVLDDEITRDIFEKYLQMAGQIVGIGRWRPRNGGMNGTFLVKNLKWSEK